jgi:regulator of protease activity HflC (stomatin/prohibitin superfamily)
MAYETEIAKLEAILNEGTGRVTIDGVTVQYSLADVRKRLTELMQKQNAAKRPRVARINLSTGF